MWPFTKTKRKVAAEADAAESKAQRDTVNRRLTGVERKLNLLSAQVNLIRHRDASPGGCA